MSFLSITNSSTTGALPWDASSRFPWHVLNSPALQWQNMPSFLVGEFLFIAVTILGFLHAFFYSSSRENRFIFVAALVAGTANDVFFMALPFVNNFWQAQAVVMLTPRLPLYIPCVYICFMYYPAVATRVLVASREFDSAWARRACLACVTGVGSALFYSPYDLIGASFLWWTWHDTDAPIRERIHGAPASSTLWTLTFGAAFAALLDWRFAVHHQQHTSSASSSTRIRSKSSSSSPLSTTRRNNNTTLLMTMSILGPVACLSTPIMMIEMGILQLCESSGAPGIRSLFLGTALFVALGVFLISKRSRPILSSSASASASRRSDNNNLLFLCSVALYSFGLILIASSFSPEEHISTGIHQKAGECGVMATDITGNVRELYLCVKTADEPYTFACDAAKFPAHRMLSPERDDDEWYTVCGKPHDDFKTWIIGVTWRSVATLLMAIGFTM